MLNKVNIYSALPSFWDTDFAFTTNGKIRNFLERHDSRHCLHYYQFLPQYIFTSLTKSVEKDSISRQIRSVTTLGGLNNIYKNSIIYGGGKRFLDNSSSYIAGQLSDSNFAQ